MIVRVCAANKTAIQRKHTFQLGSRTPVCTYTDEKGDWYAPMLAYYNPKKQTVLQTDASIKGLSACLLQDEKPVFFASKTLTDAQKDFVAKELVPLAVVWAYDTWGV